VFSASLAPGDLLIMSEMRKRHGGSSTQVETKEAADAIPKPSLYMGGTARWESDELEDIIRSSVVPKKKYVMSSISDKAKRAKDALEEDPYSITNIINLGYIYASEVQYDKSANVLIRGWKRSAELPEPSDRFKFLMKLSEVSFRNHQFKQAHAVIMDIDEPEDYYEKKAFQLLSCHCHAEIGDGSKAMAVFCKAIDGEDFEKAVKIWSACALRLKKVGVHPMAKEAVLKKARSGQNFYMDSARVQTVESWTMMSERKDEARPWLDLEDGVQPWMLVVCIIFFVLLLFYVLHWMEQRNLSNMSMSL